MRSFLRIAPALFVFLWASGFIGARYAMPWAEPFSFLAVRFALAIVVIGMVFPVIGGSHWKGSAAVHAAIAGVLVHGVYLGGVFWAIHRGMPAGPAALLVGLHPLITAILAGMVLGEKISGRHWAGLAIGFAGVVMVLYPSLGVLGSGVTVATLGATVVSVAGLSAGTLWQKRYVHGIDLLSGTLYQYVGAFVVTALLAATLEEQTYVFNGELIFAMSWLVLVLSLGAILLLMYLIREGAVSRVASLFYLVPAVTALQAWVLFGETLILVQFIGMAVAALGVAMAFYPSTTRALSSR